MKKYTCVLLSILLLLSVLAGCQSSELHSAQTGPQLTQTDPSTTAPQTQPTFTSTPVQETTVPTEPVLNCTALECEVKALPSTTMRLPSDVQWPVVIKSTAQLCALLQAWNVSTGGFREGERNSLAEFYNDEFFKENTLVLICFYADPGYSTCVVEECLKMGDGSYSISVTEPERSFGGSLSYYLYLGLHVADDVLLDAVINIHFDDTENMTLMK